MATLIINDKAFDGIDACHRREGQQGAVFYRLVQFVGVEQVYINYASNF